MAEIVGIKLDDSSGISFNEQDRTKPQTLTDVYTVYADSAQEARSISGLPRIGQPHPINGAARLISRLARGRTEALNVYDVDCNYSTRTRATTEDEDEEATDPWDLDPEWWFDSEEKMERVARDAIDTLRAIRNSAGQPIIVEWPRPIPILHVERYELTFDPDIILDYVSKMNSTDFWGAPAKKALMKRISPRPERVNDIDLFKVHYEVAFDLSEYGWQLRILDQGTQYLSGGAIVKAIDALGNPITVSLDGNGAILSPTANPVFQTFNPTTMIDFNLLNLGPF